MGRLSGAFGINGEVKLFPYSRNLKIYQQAKFLYIGVNFNCAYSFILNTIRAHGKWFLVSFLGVKSREEVTKFNGLGVFFKRTGLDSLVKNEYYWYQLYGALVVNRFGYELGRIKEISDLGNYDLLLIRAQDGKEALIPVVKNIILAIDIDHGKIIIDPPPGLLEVQGLSEKNNRGGGRTNKL